MRTVSRHTRTTGGLNNASRSLTVARSTMARGNWTTETGQAGTSIGALPCGRAGKCSASATATLAPGIAAVD